MIRRKGDLFSNETGTIGHGVNCAGVMGAGIAKPVREMYPNNFTNYRAACRSGLLRPGRTMVSIENGVTIFNMASQNKPGRDASYPWVFESLLHAANQAVEIGLDTIAIPMIGCGIGGLEDFKVEKILVTVEYIVNDSDNTDLFEWELWKQ